MKKILITGSSGMLGGSIVNSLKEKSYEVYGVSRNFNPQLSLENQFLIDLSDSNFAAKISVHFKPDIVIHTAACVNLNFCEENKEFAYEFHVNASKKLAQLFQSAAFIYISTDSVFDGQRGNYSETDVTNPLNYYAFSKQKGEESVMENHSNYAIIRTNIVGYHEPLKNSFFEWALKSLQGLKQINGFENVVFNPLYSGILADKLFQLLNMGFQSGVYNFGSSNFISKYSFVMNVAANLGLDESLISPKKLINEPNETARPLDTTLNTEKVQNLGISFPSIEENIHSLCLNLKKK
ncbi:MAG: SDR family oxidoreductase [Ginsengibacter sp.]